MGESLLSSNSVKKAPPSVLWERVAFLELHREVVSIVLVGGRGVQRQERSPLVAGSIPVVWSSFASSAQARSHAWHRWSSASIKHGHRMGSAPIQQILKT